MFSLKGKTALITGSSQGIGFGIARALARAGADIVLNSHEQPKDVDKLVAEISTSGSRAVFVQADVTNQGERQRLVEGAVKAFGRLDILVSNAGQSHFGRGILATQATLNDFGS